ncbi:MAG: YtxH domain-containing protein [Candidatus Aminicenantes bacterium]|nr:YtxH domain-containing protein [Candidatus Aminicenantes bacterium]
MASNGSGAVEVTLSFLLGAATGFILGVLLAPASGEETRKKIQEKAAEVGTSAREGYEKIAKEAEKGIKVVKEKTHEGIDSIKEFVEKKKEEIGKKPAAPFDKETK